MSGYDFFYDESYVIISAMTKYKSGATYYFAVKAYKTYKKNTYTSSSSSKKVVINKASYMDIDIILRCGIGMI